MATEPFSEKNSNSNGKHVDSEQQRHLNKLEQESATAKHKADQAELEAKLKRGLEEQVHKHNLEMRDREQQIVMGVVAGVSEMLGKSIEIYERVQKSKLNAVEAKYRVILELAKIDKDLAKEFIKNAGADLAGEAASAAARDTVYEIGRALSRTH
jgi:predicted house-cleaning noncanonical NTP pyrophosphatase (MazG superfamily)